MDIPSPPSAPRRALCPNCDAEITGPYCSGYGQQQKTLNKYFWTLSGEVLDEIFRPDSRAARTLLLFKPGYLTTEYFAGRRARYIPPIRLYLIISFLFFILLPFLGNLLGTAQMNIGGDDSTLVVNSDGTPATDEDWRDQLESDVTVSVPGLSEEQNDVLSNKLRIRLGKMIEQAEEEPGVVFRDFMDMLSAAMFFLLPIFAIFLKIFYIGSGVYYAEHLLLAVHNHCFLFVILFVSGLSGYVSSLFGPVEQGTLTVVAETASTGMTLWMPIYLYMSMKHTYGQGHFLTLFKFLLIALTYLLLAVFGIVAAFLVQVSLS